MNGFAIASGSLKILANDLIRICNDLRLLNSGPSGGLGEIELPGVEPGSSIMPGKVNPSIVEVVTMVSFQVLGNDLTVNLAVQAGQLELNVMTPVIMFNLLKSIELLTNSCGAFENKCVCGIKAKPHRCSHLLDRSLCTATALSAYLGYKGTSAIVSKALLENKSLEDVIFEYKLMSPDEFQFITCVDQMTRPNHIDKQLTMKIKGSTHYSDFMKTIN
jgi:aspartate ammonia-lyase